MSELRALRERLASLDTTAVCDADKTIRVMDPGIRPINAGRKMLGVARTVRCRDDFLSVIKALDESQPGEALVIDAGGGPRAVAGELFATEARRRGLVGIVVDGACRDLRSLQTMTDFSVYARHVSPMAGTTTRVFTTQTRIVCGGVVVEPGDLLFADLDGVVVLSEAELRKVIAAAEAIQRAEEAALARMASGDSLLAMLNFAEHHRSREAGRDSTLRFTLP